MRCPSCHPPEPERLWRRGHRCGFDIDTQQIAGRRFQCIHAPAFQYLLPCLSHFSDNTSSLLSGRQRTERQRGFLTYQGPPTKVQNKIKSAHWHPTLGPLFQPPKGPMLLPYVVAPRAAGCMGVCSASSSSSSPAGSYVVKLSRLEIYRMVGSGLLQRVPGGRKEWVGGIYMTTSSGGRKGS